MTGAQVTARRAVNGMLCFIFSIVFLMLTSAHVPWLMLGLFAGCGALTYMVINAPRPVFDLRAHFGDKADFIASVLRGTDATNCDRLRATYNARNAEANDCATHSNDTDTLRQSLGATLATVDQQDSLSRDGRDLAAGRRICGCNLQLCDHRDDQARSPVFAIQRAIDLQRTNGNVVNG